MNTALLVIDVQQGLCEGDDEAFAAAETIARINTLSQRARAAGAPVILVQHESTHGYLVHGTPGWQLAHGLQTAPTDLRLRKTAADAFHRTELEATLQRLGVAQVAICGMHTEFCIDTTTRRALALGFPVLLAADAHTTRANGVLDAEQIVRHHNATLTNIHSFGPRVRALAAADIRFDDAARAPLSRVR